MERIMFDAIEYLAYDIRYILHWGSKTTKLCYV